MGAWKTFSQTSQNWYLGYLLRNNLSLEKVATLDSLSQALWPGLSWIVWSFDGKGLGWVFYSNLRLDVCVWAEECLFQVWLLPWGSRDWSPPEILSPHPYLPLWLLPKGDTQQLHNQMAVTVLARCRIQLGALSTTLHLHIFYSHIKSE